MEDRVLDTPARRQNDTNYQSTVDLSDGESDYGSYPEYETVATVPLNRANSPTAPTTQQFTQRLTQPTQIIERPPLPTSSPSAPKSSFVQVASSSPIAPSSSNSRPPFAKPGSLSNSMAPSGTQFRPPAMARPPVKRAPVINLSDDDGPRYRGGSSDDDDIQFVGNTNIKPSTFVQSARSPEKEKIPESPLGAGAAVNRFKEITASAFYNPSANGTNGVAKRAVGDMSSAPDDSSRLLKKPRSEESSGTASQHEMSLDAIPDYLMRAKVERLLKLLPQASVQVCFQALITKRGNEQDARDYLCQLYEPKGNSDDELSLDLKTPQVAPAKQQVQVKSRIQDRWAAKQQQQQQVRRYQSPEKAALQPREHLIGAPRSRLLSPASSDRTTTPIKKKPGRLIRGQRGRRRSPSASPELVAIESDTSDSDAAEEVDDSALEAKVLNFFNTCSTEDLMDIAEINKEVADAVISRRRFPSLQAVRQVAVEDTASKPQAKARKTTKKPIGDKIVDKCLDMWTGYEAVDALVTHCESLGKPIAAQMKQWGVDIFGAKEECELDLVSFNRSSSDGTHDSGIGTPSSRRSSTVDGEEIKEATKRKNQLLGQPAIMSDEIKMKDYQIVGINWLNLLFQQNLSCILADDMGLGKTCQVIAFLAHLFETGVTGPHLVVVPSSTLENWLREFSVFCPKLTVWPYYANQAGRAEIRQQIEDERDNINVVITTYTIAKAKVDAAFLRSLDFSVCVYDEGHMLKNSKSTVYEKLIRIPAQFRLLLTGTPLQNNLQELASLLGFILPSVFKERKEDLEYIFSAKAKTVDDTHSALLSAQRIARAKSMLTPFVLRRKKHQVIDLPAKIARVEYCEMNDAQKEIYTHETETVKQLIADRAAGKKVGNKSANILMKLRQAAIHPLFWRRHYDNKTLSRIAKACLSDETWAKSDPDQIYAELVEYNDFEIHTLCERNPKFLSKFMLKNEPWMKSGKVEKLCELLKAFKENGDRTLVFSQFTMVMDILEHVLETLHISFFRLDGTTSVEERQSLLDAFHEKTEIPVFLLSTKAGGAGINLACANKVIIFDSSFNPQDDIQAENRAHRVGQTREVEVVRLVVKGTIEEQMYALGQTKLALDQRVAGDDEGGAASKKSEEAGMKVVEDMIIAEYDGDGEKKEADKPEAAGTS